MSKISPTLIAAPVGVILYLATTVLVWEKPKAPAPAASVGAGFPVPSWEFNNPEADQLINELKSEKKALDVRQQQLDELALRLQSERAELGQVTQSVRMLQSNFDTGIVRVKVDETANLKKLAKVYGTMSSDSVAAVLAQMDNREIVKIFGFLKDDQIGAILDSLSKQGPTQAKRAAELSDLMRLLAHDTTSK